MKKVKLSKLILIILSITILLTVISAALFVILYPREELIQVFTFRAEEALNKNVTIKDLSYGLDGIILEDVVISSGLSAEDPKLLSAEEVKIRFSILPLIRKQLEISEIIINSLRVEITHENGKFNLEDLFQGNKDEPESSVTTSISYITLNEAGITLKSSPEFLKPLQGKYLFDGTITVLGEKEFIVSDSKVTLPDSRGVIAPEMKILLLDEDFEINADLELKRCSLVWVYQFGEDVSQPYRNFSGHIKNLRITSKSIDGSVKGYSILSNQRPLYVDGSCKVFIPGNLVTLLNVKGKMDNSVFVINNLSFTTSGRVVKFDVSDIDGIFYDLRTLLSFLPGQLYGGVAGGLAYVNNLYNGVFKLRDAGYNKEAALLGNVNTDIVIKNNSFYKENIEAEILKQPCRISIATTDNKFERIAVNLTAGVFNFKIDSDKLTETGGASDQPDIQFYGNIDIGQLNFSDYQFQNFSANYSLKDKKLTLNRISSGFMGGSLNAGGSVDTLTGKYDVDMKVSFENIKVHDLANTVTDYKGRLFGIARGRADVNFSVGKGMGILDTLDGRMEFNIDKGKIVNTGIQRHLGVWLSELKYKLKDLEFNEISGDFTASNGMYNINLLRFNASEIKMNLRGGFSRKELMELGDEKLPEDLKITLEFHENFIRDLPNISRGAIMLDSRLQKKDKWYNAVWQQ